MRATTGAGAQIVDDLKTIRTDIVGSLLRPAALKAARRRFDEGGIDAEELRAIEDEAVRAAVALQEAAGLDVVSDGEMRRLNFQDSFGASVEGYDAQASTLRVYERRVEGSAPLRTVLTQTQSRSTGRVKQVFIGDIANDSAQTVVIGKDFNGAYHLWVSALLIVGAIAIVQLRRRDRRIATATTAMIVGGGLHAAYITAIGGDYMHGRLLLPAFFAVALPASITIGRVEL